MQKKKLSGYYLLHTSTPYLMLIPGIVGIMFVNIIPSLQAIVMGFYSDSFTKRSEFVGFEKFERILKLQEFWQVLGNTFFWSLATLFFATVLGIFAAILTNRPYMGKGFFRIVFMIPWITPPVVASMVWKTMFNETLSPINDALIMTNIIDSSIPFLINPSWRIGPLSVPMFSLLVVNVWNVFPFMMIMILAAMQSIDDSYYEAASIDGAGKITQFFKITLPLIMPVLSISLLLQGIWQFNSFNFNYLVAYGGPLNTTKTMAVMIYQKAFAEFDYGQAGAISAVMLGCILIPAAFYIRHHVNRLETVRK